jgi:hypothetical protein
MSFGLRFQRKMTSVVTVRPRTGTTGNGQPAYGALTYHRAYISSVGVLFRNAQGQQITSGGQIFLQPTECNADGTPKTGAAVLTALPENSEITYPNPSSSGGVAKPVLLKVDGLADETGLQMWQAFT